MPLIKNIPGCQALYAGALLLWSRGGGIRGHASWPLNGTRRTRILVKEIPYADFETVDTDTKRVPERLVSRWRIVASRGNSKHEPVPVDVPPPVKVSFTDRGQEKYITFELKDVYNGDHVYGGTVIEYPPKGS